MRLTLDHLRRYAVARTLFKPTTLGRALLKLGFVQADPIRAPARAQDLILRHRVMRYHAGDLERRYSRLPIEEDFFVNYGFLPRAHQRLMHPRTARVIWSAARHKKAQAVLEFIRERGASHPRAVDAHFSHGKVKNWFGGSTNASTELLDDMHYRGQLRVVRRDSGTRVYAARPPDEEPLDSGTAAARFDTLIDIVVHQYAPLPGASLGQLVSLLIRGVPQWRKERAAALARAKARLARAKVSGVEWYWPESESPTSRRWSPDDRVRLLAPFDPVVWDRRRFSLLWEWTYRFEAYTPAPKRLLGYYALPMLWRDRIVGWGNVTASAGRLKASFGYVAGPPEDIMFNAALRDELDRLRGFLKLAEIPDSGPGGVGT